MLGHIGFSIFPLGASPTDMVFLFTLCICVALFLFALHFLFLLIGNTGVRKLEKRRKMGGFLVDFSASSYDKRTYTELENIDTTL